MVTKQANFDFGALVFERSTTVEDMEQGIDGWLGEIPIAWRKRRIPLIQYNEISIRFTTASGNRMEYHKLLDGSFKALLYFFQFSEAIIVCRTEDVIDCLDSYRFTVKQNHDRATSAIYINVNTINHLKLPFV